MPAFNMSRKELAALQTKKIWEKVIGAKFNVNDEVNQIAAHHALTSLGMAQLSGTTKSGKR